MPTSTRLSCRATAVLLLASAVALLGIVVPTPAHADRTSPVGGPTFTAVGTESVVFEGRLYFSANDGVTGNELWRTDGTAAGTVLVADLRAGPNSSTPRNFTVVGDRLYFNADATDPTDPLSFTVNYYDGSTVEEAVISCSCSSDGRPAWGEIMGTVNGLALFVGYTGTANLIAKVGPGSGAATFVGPHVPTTADAAVLGGHLYFGGAITDDGERSELYRTDGTSTSLVKSIAPGDVGSEPRYFVAAGSRVFFLATTAGQGREIWSSDGTSAGTVPLRDHTPGPISGSYENAEMTAHAGKLYYTVTDSVTGKEVWVSDGTPGGTQVTRDRAPGTASSAPRELTSVGSTLMFMDRGTLVRTDGTPAGTVPVRELGTGTQLTAYGSRVYLRGSLPGGTRSVVLRSSGTEASTVQVTEGGFDTAPGSGDALPSGFAALGTRIIFSSQYPGGGSNRRLYSIDTTRPDALVALGKAKVRGKAKVGKKLKATPPSFNVEGVTVKYQWLANGKVIKKATKKTLKLKKKFQGKRISVRVTATANGDQVTSTSKKTKKVKKR